MAGFSLACAANVAPAADVPTPVRPLRSIIVALREADAQAAWTEKISTRSARHHVALQRLQREYGLRAARPALPTLVNLLRGDPADPSASAELSAAELSAAGRARFPGRAARAPVQPAAVDLVPLYLLDPENPAADVESLCKALQADPAVQFAEPDHAVTILGGGAPDPLGRLQWPLENTGQAYPVPDGRSAKGLPGSDVEAVEAWPYARGSSQIIVAVLDTGVDLAHPDLAGRLWQDAAGRYGYDFANDDPDPSDDNGHGTHCAGIIAAAGGNGMGIAGAAPPARIMAVKFIGASGTGDVSDSFDSLFYATANGADVISNSWGTPWPSAALQLVVDYAWSQGVIVVAAAGNSASSSPTHPAGLEHVLAVAATDARDRLASFSNFGSWVDLAAPGVDVLSLRAAGTDVYEQFGEPGSHIFEEDYYIASGTSMACPHAAAGAALLCNRFKDLRVDDIGLRLRGTADDLAHLNPGHEADMGGGRLNLKQALLMAPQPRLRLTGLQVEEAEGDGNGIPERGEILSITTRLTCEWQSAGGISARLSSTDGLASVLSAGRDTAGLEPGASVELEWSVLVHAEAIRFVNLDLQVRPVNGQEDHKPLTVDLSWPLHDGWPQTTSGNRLQTVAADLDGDGLQEIVVGGDLPRIEVRGRDGRPWRSPWPMVVPPVQLLAAGDLDGDPAVEILATTSEAIHAFNGDGAAVSGWPIARTDAGVVVADLDGAGPDEVIVVDDHGVQVLTGHAGDAGFSWPSAVDQSAVGVAVTDLDLDGERELLAAVHLVDEDDLSSIYALRRDGSSAGDDWPVTFDGQVLADALIAGDITGDGLPEIVAATLAGAVHAWDRHGQPLPGYVSRFLPDDPDITGAALADVDGDGLRDILLAGRSPAIHALNHAGDEVRGWPVVLDRPYSFVMPFDNRVQAAGDLDGDGRVEILVGTLNGLALFAGDASPFPIDLPLANLVHGERAEFAQAASLADLDGDGRVDLLLGSSERIVLHSFAGRAADVHWAGDRNTPGRTGSAASAVPARVRVDFNAAAFRPGDLVRVTVRDDDHNADPQELDQATVELSSTLESKPEVVQLIETGPASGEFSAEVQLVEGLPAPDGAIQVAGQDVLTARYVDGERREWSGQAAVDGRGPAIVAGSIEVVTGFDGQQFFADVSWETDEPSRGRVHYGPGPITEMTATTALTTSASVRVSPLEPDTAYFFFIEALDALDNLTIDDNGGGFYSMVASEGLATSVVVRLAGRPIEDAYGRVKAWGLDGELVANFGTAPFSPAGVRWVDAPAGQPLRLEVTVIVLGQGFLGTFLSGPFLPPAQVPLDLDQLQLKFVAGSVPLTNAEVRLYDGCSERSVMATTDGDGRVLMAAQSGQALRCSVRSGITFWTPATLVAPGVYDIDVLATAPNVVAIVRRGGAPSAGEAVYVFKPDEEEHQAPDQLALTDTEGRTGLWLCPGESFGLEAEYFPDSVRSAVRTAPEFGAAAEEIVLDLEPAGIVGGNPPHEAIDARQPLDPDTGEPAGWNTVELTLAEVEGGWLLEPDDVVVSETGGDGQAPGVAQILPAGSGKVQVRFDAPMEPGAWTRVSHPASRTSMRWGFLPADVDGDATSAAGDVLALVDVLNGTLSRPLHATDLDRDGRVVPADILRLIDLLEGSGGPAWRGRSLPRARELYWVDDRRRVIRALDLDSGAVRDVLSSSSSLSGIRALAVDAGRGRLYWASAHGPDDSLARIGVAELDGSNIETLFERQGLLIDGLALDPLRRWLLWTDSFGRRIQRGDLTGGAVDDVVVFDPEDDLIPTALALDPAAGTMYWSMGKSIWRAAVEVPAGETPAKRSDLELLMELGDNQVTDLAIDAPGDVLCWSTVTFGPEGSIACATRDGHRPRVLADSGLIIPSGIAIDAGGSSVIWTDSGLSTVQRVALDGSAVEFLVVQGLEDPRTVRLLP
jgi:thermitase